MNTSRNASKTIFNTIASACKRALGIGQALLPAGYDVNARDEHGRTPLHMACIATATRRLLRADVYARDVGQITRLLAAGADVNACDKNGFTPLHMAQDAGEIGCFRTPAYSAEQIDVIKMLLAAGADVNALDRFGRTPLHMAQDAGQTQALLDAGADPNVQVDGGYTALFVSAMRFGVEQVRALLVAGADPWACGELSRVGTESANLIREAQLAPAKAQAATLAAAPAPRPRRRA